MGLNEIKARVAKAEAEAGRAPGAVTLIAVSKVQPLNRVEAVLEQGHRVFGENRVQEAAGKWPALMERFEGVALHLIGPLQGNKARQAVELFDAIHSVDRLKLAQRLAGLAQERGQCPELFLQVNTGEEPQKAGVPPGEADAFVAQCRALDLPVRGLTKIAARNGLDGLSMGMSGDFERAIALGATHVRVGSAIFGERAYG
jgi:pyridoxal phosphate enzyme (YggS family)